MPIDIQHQQMGYDRSSTMFSPDGHLLQVEYAEKTVRLGSASIGMKCSDGVFILADKRVRDKLIVKESAVKVHEIDSHVFASVAGIMSDARILLERVRVLAQQNMVTYDSPIEPELVVKDIADNQQKFTQYGGGRPFGVAVMVAGVNENTAELFVSDITGNYFAYHANAIGENDDKIKEILREKYNETLNIKTGIQLALNIFKETKGDKFDIDNFEVVCIKNGDKKLKRALGKDIK